MTVQFLGATSRLSAQHLLSFQGAHYVLTDTLETQSPSSHILNVWWPLRQLSQLEVSPPAPGRVDSSVATECDGRRFCQAPATRKHKSKRQASKQNNTDLPKRMYKGQTSGFLHTLRPPLTRAINLLRFFRIRLFASRRSTLVPDLTDSWLNNWRQWFAVRLF